MPLVIGVLKDIHPGERRLSVVPDVVKKYQGLGASVVMQKDAAKGAHLRIIAGEEVRKADARKLPEKRGNYKFPPMRLLAEPAAPTNIEDESFHQETADMLVKTLEEFGVRVTPGDVHTRPDAHRSG